MGGAVGVYVGAVGRCGCVWQYGGRWEGVRLCWCVWGYGGWLWYCAGGYGGGVGVCEDCECVLGVWWDVGSQPHLFHLGFSI